MIKNLTPKQSWALLQEDPRTVLIDVRTAIEHSFVGTPPGAIHIPWKEFPTMKVNGQFIAQVKLVVNDVNTPILLLCRSGQHSLAEARALEDSGYKCLINIVEGFEGAIDNEKHRENINGWKFHNLPWIQS